MLSTIGLHNLTRYQFDPAKHGSRGTMLAIHDCIETTLHGRNDHGRKLRSKFSAMCSTF
ncbi:hypothetical protein MPLSOD_30003 [Mesorhizobium sp. SOD10]|nr:hypothetical protein MPLSOD_30003 [Mesorhizobium sp. SOD10]